MPAPIPAKTHDYTSQRGNWMIDGLWDLRQAGEPMSPPQDAASGQVHKGHFRARKLGEPWAEAWEVELWNGQTPGESMPSEEGVSTDFPNQEGPPYREDFSKRHRSRPAIRKVSSHNHRELMAELKRKLHAQYGPIRELHVLFSQARGSDAPVPGWIKRGRSWWGRLAGRRQDRISAPLLVPTATM